MKLTYYGAAALLLSASTLQAASFTETKLTPSDGGPNAWFGWSVALSGATALVGSLLGANNGFATGSAYLFDASTGNQIAKLTASDGAVNDWFGASVALSGNTAIVGAPYDDGNGAGSGSAYLFDTSTGTQIAKLTAGDGAAGDQFGYAVALSGGTALVGAFGDDDNGDGSGSAYLFDVTTGNQIAKLTPNDGAANDQFGHSVAIAGDIALVGSPKDDGFSGSAYLFDVTTGNQLAKLTASDAATGDEFGWSVALSGNTALVGARLDDDDGFSSGSAYLFEVSTGSEIAKLTASDGAVGDSFGWSVALSGNTALVGALYDDDDGNSSGSAYLYDVSTGSEIAKLTASDGAANDQFGISVALSGSTALVGAPFDDDVNNDSGAAYLYAPGPSTSPVPLPAGAWLLLSGLGLILARRAL